MDRKREEHEQRRRGMDGDGDGDGEDRDGERERRMGRRGVDVEGAVGAGRKEGQEGMGFVGMG